MTFILLLWTYPAFSQHHLGSPILSDLRSHLPDRIASVYYEPDQTVWAHEMSHGINGQIRQAMGNGFNGFYLLNDKCLVLTEPHCRLSDVATRCQFHGFLFQQVLIDQQIGLRGYAGWNEQPLYLIDEMIAYTHGYLVGIAIGDPNAKYDRLRAKEMEYYVSVLVQCIRELDPKYDRKPLNELIKWNDARLEDAHTN